MGARASAPEGRTAGTPPPPLHPKSRRATTVGIVEQSGPRHVVVLVLGDVGRSPRMQYHAMSLASHGVRVTLVGYSGERCISAIENSPRVTSHRFAPPLSGPWSKRLRRRAYPIFAAIKALALLARVMYELAWRAAKPVNAILVQNPPSLPGLACVYLACLLRRCPMVLDWHNLGFTMFDRGPRHPLVWITRRAEAFFGRRASVNIAVSHAMRIWIMQHFGIKEAYIVYDQPPDFFHAPTLSERHELFKKLAETSPDFADAVRAHAQAAAVVAAAAAASTANADADAVVVSDVVAAEEAHDYAADAAAAVAADTAAAADDAADDDVTVATDAVSAAGLDASSPRSAASGDPPRDPPRDNAEPYPKKPRNGARQNMGRDGAEGEVQGEVGEERTPFTTRKIDGALELRRDRPALLVSSTSWTPDEDFSVLLEALRRFDARTASGACPSLPLVMVVVTGKGPQKAMYVERMKAAKMTRVAICTAWLEPDDYPVLLGSADLGICLHTSTSGVDLPMKVVDMFGCGVPVCAVHFDCLQELVRDGYNGCVFRDSTQLALQLEALLDGFPRGGCELEGYRANVKEVARWKENWDEFAWPLFSKLGRLQPLSNSAKAKAKGGEGERRRRGGGGGAGGLWETGWSTVTVVEVVVVPVMALVILLVVVPSLPSRIEGWAVGAMANVAARWRG